MNWSQASILIFKIINAGMDLNTNRSKFRVVQEAPPYQCKRYNYNNSVGYKVRIGDINFVEIPMSMLEKIFNSAIENNGLYNNDVFTKSFPQQAKDHGCHVHVVGRIFEVAGVAIKKDSNYQIL